MSKLRRFSVPSLEGLKVGAHVVLSAEESRHLRVLRMKAGAEFEGLDPKGRVARVVIDEMTAEGVSVRMVSFEASTGSSKRVALTLAVAWPKGKRASVLVEKCAELGVDTLVPIQFERSVVSKDDESEGVIRLRRIATEASKQSRRDDTMCISSEMTLSDFLTDFMTRYGAAGTTLMLDPRASDHLVNALVGIASSVSRIALIIGPEGGLAPAEIALGQRMGVGTVRMAENVLRIETAALAAGAICGALLT